MCGFNVRKHAVKVFSFILAKQDAPLMPSRKFINKKGGPIAPPLNNTPASQPVRAPPPPPPAPAPEPPQQVNF